MDLNILENIAYKTQNLKVLEFFDENLIESDLFFNVETFIEMATYLNTPYLKYIYNKYGKFHMERDDMQYILTGINEGYESNKETLILLSVIYPEYSDIIDRKIKIEWLNYVKDL